MTSNESNRQSAIGNDLRVVDLRKSFLSPARARIEVLRGLSLLVRPGESVAIMGASGSGKSTLLHILGGLDEPDHGSISIGEHEIGSLSPAESARLRQTHIAFVFQFHYLLSDLTAAENVAMPLLIRRLNRRDALERAQVVLRDVGMEERAEHPVTHLSGGEQQRVAVARALVTEPQMVLADEPTGNLDTSMSEDIARTLTNYTHTRSRMAVIATHNPALARRCDRILTLVDGRLIDFIPELEQRPARSMHLGK
ncbi:MAG TPA: ABC transporter ATP-binding protein [Pyrinomonadaceae bacterium]